MEPVRAARPGRETRLVVRAVDGGRARARTDRVATEEPLEIRLDAGGEQHRLTVTMRTPGDDFELAAGFLHAEGVIAGSGDLTKIRYCVDPEVDDEQRYNIVTVDLASGVAVDLDGLERHFGTTSACGVCGKASLEALTLDGCTSPGPGPVIDPDTVERLPERLREAQRVFESTGGLHAAALFDASGELVCVREDVGRHNALDKLVGWALLEDRLPLDDGVVLVSGRASYELVQKALRAGAPVICAVSAPSSLAVDVAEAFGMTLVGFLRGSRFNVYTGAERIRT